MLDLGRRSFVRYRGGGEGGKMGSIYSVETGQNGTVRFFLQSEQSEYLRNGRKTDLPIMTDTGQNRVPKECVENINFDIK